MRERAFGVTGLAMSAGLAGLAGGAGAMMRSMPSRPNLLEKQIAASVGASPALTPWLGELFADLQAMGSMPERVVQVLRKAGIGADAEVADLACGKGAIGIALACELGVRVTGVDASTVFVRAARAAARTQGVGDRCRFVVRDIRGFRARADAAVMIGLFGGDDAIDMLRACVKPSGVYVFDDAVRVNARGRIGGVTLPEIKEMVRERGDVVLSAQPIPARVWHAHAARTIRALEHRAARLAEREPSLRRLLARFVEDQYAAAALLETKLRPVIVAARRAGLRAQ